MKADRREGKIDRNAVSKLKEYIMHKGVRAVWSVNLYAMIYAFLANHGWPDIRVIGSSNVSHFRNIYEKLKMFVCVPIIWQLDLFVFGSTRQQSDWLRIYPIRRSQCVTIHNVGDIEKFSVRNLGLRMNEARRQLGLSDSAFTVVMVAQFRVEKACADLILAVKSLLDQGEDIQILLVGSGDMQNSIRTSVIELGMSDRVFFGGLLDDVRPALVAAEFLH